MTYLLGQLSDSDKRELVAFTRAEADRVSLGDYQDFLRTFPLAMASENDPLACASVPEYTLSRSVETPSGLTELLTPGEAK
jgi:hypothetical protein